MTDEDDPVIKLIVYNHQLHKYVTRSFARASCNKLFVQVVYTHKLCCNYMVLNPICFASESADDDDDYEQKCDIDVNKYCDSDIDPNDIEKNIAKEYCEEQIHIFAKHNINLLKET